MFHFKLVFAIAVLMSFLQCGSIKKSHRTGDVLPAASLNPYGRFTVNQNNALELIGSAVHFGFSFEGTQCQVFAAVPNANSHNYLQYELDGVYQKRVSVSGRNMQPIVLSAPGAGRHTVWIYKATEAHTGPVTIEKIEGRNIKALLNPAAPLIEFIGNSITCGAAADASEIPCSAGEYHDHHNAYYAYGPRLARALKANYIVSSVSGIGVYRNWNSDGPAMPEVYEKVDFQFNSPALWNFKKYSPKIVSIALGTNDLSRGDGVKKRLPFDSAMFINSYVKFIQFVKSVYPKARIALLSSPMIGGQGRLLLQNCLETVKQRVDLRYPSDAGVALYFFQPMQPHGCAGHPSVEDHAVLASELIPFFRKLLL